MFARKLVNRPAQRRVAGRPSPSSVCAAWSSSTLAQRAAVLHLHLEAAGGAEALHRRRREDGDEGLLDRGEACVQRLSHGLARSSCASRSSNGLSGKNTMPQIGRVHEPVTESPVNCDRVRHRRMLQGDRRHLPDDRVGAVERGGIGQLGDTEQVALVLRGDEPAGTSRNSSTVSASRPAYTARGQPGADGEAAPRRRRSAPSRPKNAVERPEEPARGRGRAAGSAGHVGASWRLEQEAASAGDSVSELNARDDVETAMVRANWRKNWPVSPADEGARHEHRAEHQRDGDDRAGDLVHRLVAASRGREALLDVPLHVLDHHDGVVHHDADGQHQAEQREVVEREAERRAARRRCRRSRPGPRPAG